MSARPSVALVVNTFDDAGFLGAALDSAMRQTRPFDEVVVVDDGSAESPAPIVAAYPGVRLVRQENRGLAAARNAGLQAVGADYVVFLDADDRLLPEAVAAGLAAHARHPDAAFVYGAHRMVDAAGAPLGGPLGGDRFAPLGEDAYAALLRGNMIAMHATVMYRRAALCGIGGFDPGLKRCEDYDVYLRLVRRHRAAGYPLAVAEYRRHGSNMSADRRAMLETVLRVHARQREAAAADPLTARSWRRGRRNWRNHYAEAALAAAIDAWRHGEAAAAARALAEAAAFSPRHAARQLRRLAAKRLRRGAPRRGRVRMGDLGAVRPVSANFGFDRGTPIDRYYVERFLAAEATWITGRVLEVGDDSYCRRFGHAIGRQDVLHVHAGNPAATLVGDMSAPGVLPEGVFDCLVLTQTLHLVFDLQAAAAAVHAALRPGGVALLTVPGISPIDRGEWGASWYWSLTAASARRLFEPVFGAGNVTVGVRGNAYAATCFVQGLALEEVDRDRLDVFDPAFPVIVTVRARKPDPGGNGNGEGGGNGNGNGNGEGSRAPSGAAPPTAGGA